MLPTPTLQPFTQLRTNVKANLAIDLAPCTAIVGPNRSSKTGVLDTIRLALTGKHPIGGSASDLAELVVPGSERMIATMSGPSGIAHFQQEIPGGKARKPTHRFSGALERMQPEEQSRILPIDHVGDMVRFGTARAREALMHRFGRATEIPTPIGLNAKQLALWTTARDTNPGEPADTLANMAKWLRSEKLARGRRAKALEQSVEEQRAKLETASGGRELLDSYERKLTQAQAWERTSALRARHTELEVRLAALPPAETIDSDVAAARERAANAITTGESLLAALDIALSADDGHTCPLCATTNVDLHETRRRVHTRLEQRQAEYRQYGDSVAVSMERERLYAELAGVDAGLVGAPESYVGPPADELREEVTRIKQVETLRRRAEDDAREMHRLRDEAEICKVLEHEAAKLLKELLRNVADEAEAAVNKYMPLGFQAKVVITDKATEWRVLGSDSRPHKRGGMSGSEYGALVVALACAWTEESPLRVLLLDDTDLGPFDPANLHALLDTLRGAVERGDLTQVIVGWNRPSEIPASWHKVFRGSE